MNDKHYLLGTDYGVIIWYIFICITIMNYDLILTQHDNNTSNNFIQLTAYLTKLSTYSMLIYQNICLI